MVKPRRSAVNFIFILTVADAPLDYCLDLLADRATEADALELVRAARAALKGELIVAGSVDTPARIQALADCGADAFTIGTAAITGRFAAGIPGILGQLQAILAACR